MITVQQLLFNRTILAAAAAWVAAQLLKTMVDGLRHRRFNPHMLVGPGGMPSAHSALVCGLATSTAFSPGSRLAHVRHSRRAGGASSCTTPPGFGRL